MVITLNFINFCNTATIIHGDAKLHISHFDLLMCCIQIWNCINTRNFGQLHEKLKY